MGALVINQNQITRIKINGFKSIQSADIDLGMLNVLIGANGAGKSNFISLFVMLQKIIEKKLQQYVGDHGGVDSLLFFGRKETESLGVEFLFGENGYGFQLGPTQSEQLSFRKEWFYWDTIGQKPLGYGHLESEWEKGTRTGIDSYVQPIFKEQKWRIYHFHDTGSTAKLKTAKYLHDNIELAADAGNLAAFLYRLKEMNNENYRRIVKTIQFAAPFFDDFSLVPDRLSPDKIRLEWKHINSDMLFTPHQLSDGTLRFMCLATLLMQPETLSPETIIIDEPELGLHPYAIKLLSSMIKSASHNKQIIISTQSVELLNEFDMEDIVVVDHIGNSSSFRRFSQDEFSAWLEEDYSVGELWKKNLLGGRPSKWYE